VGGHPRPVLWDIGYRHSDAAGADDPFHEFVGESEIH
jgi:hypothetical protein